MMYNDPMHFSERVLGLCTWHIYVHGTFMLGQYLKRKILSLLGVLHFAYTSASELRVLPGFLVPFSSRHAFYLLARIQPSTTLPWLPVPAIHGSTFLLCCFPRTTLQRNLHEC
jgi:hypothetical protein